MEQGLDMKAKDVAPKENTKISRIFLVDDHPIVRQGLARLLAQEPDFEICGEAGDADTGKARILESKPDLAIIDISLDGSGSNGLDLTKSLQREAPDILVLVVSMHEEDVYAERALRAGARGYIMKQETTERIIEAMREVLRGSIFVSTSIKNKLLAKVARGKNNSEEALVKSLGDRELEVFRLIGQGYGSRQIAEKLKVSVKTVDAHREHIKAKLQLKTAPELLERAVRFVLKNS